MNNLDYLIIYNSEYNKIRIGSLNDGGYVIADGLEYDLLLSCGISDDITFEDYFTNKYNVNCYAYDGTINNLPHYNNNKINFIKKNISKIESDITTNLLDIINLNNNYKIVTTKKIENINCTLDDNLTVKDIAALSTNVKYIIAINTGVIVGLFNKYTLNNVEKVYIFDRLLHYSYKNFYKINNLSDINI